MTTVALIAFTGAQSLDVAGPMDVFAEANRFLLTDEHYQLEIIGIDRSPLRCSNGVGLIADRHWSEVNEPIDLVLVAGGPGLVNQTFGEDFQQWLRAAASRARRFGSICSGAFRQGTGRSRQYECQKLCKNLRTGSEHPPGGIR
ncbi:DJ-1/PfpI family protein [Paraburkholderia sp. DGU8]|jgi:transcriptional regulator GlxA family with amidase domain|uniref:DJ-1/PfpI family protein n=1 Tax=Paraburkholderia sp. DGU8 TaxID=3161997 RepID=UPI003467B254